MTVSGQVEAAQCEKTRTHVVGVEILRVGWCHTTERGTWNQGGDSELTFCDRRKGNYRGDPVVSES